MWTECAFALNAAAVMAEYAVEADGAGGGRGRRDARRGRGAAGAEQTIKSEPLDPWAISAALPNDITTPPASVAAPAPQRRTLLVHGDDALARVGQGGCAGGAEDRVTRNRQRARERQVLKRDLAELCRRNRTQ